MRKAAAIIDDVYDYILGELKEGVTEKQIAALIEEKARELGAEKMSFDTIVAFGAGGAEPHHVPTDSALGKGMFVTVDMGAVYDGQCSDFTRTAVFGMPDEEQKRIYDIVYCAQKNALAAVADGVTCKAVDDVARNYISLRGYGAEYVHGTGHGVGSEIHEPPTLNPKSEETLHTGEVVTVEPGIYIPGRMGVRIEDMIAVGDAAPFSRHATELIIL